MKFTTALIGTVVAFVILDLCPKTGAAPEGCKCDVIGELSSKIAKMEEILRASRGAFIWTVIAKRAPHTSGNQQDEYSGVRESGKASLHCCPGDF